MQEAESRKPSPNVSMQYLWFGFGRVALFSWPTRNETKWLNPNNLKQFGLKIVSIRTRDSGSYFRQSVVTSLSLKLCGTTKQRRGHWLSRKKKPGAGNGGRKIAFPLLPSHFAPSSSFPYDGRRGTKIRAVNFPSFFSKLPTFLLRVFLCFCSVWRRTKAGFEIWARPS